MNNAAIVLIFTSLSLLTTWVVCDNANKRLLCMLRSSSKPLFERYRWGVFRPNKFKWTASLDASTGFASSFESSVLPHFRSKYVIENIFASYPQWLCRGSVTLGFLVSRLKLNGDVAVCDAITGTNLLLFGKAILKKVDPDKIVVDIPIKGGFFSLSPSENVRNRQHGGFIRFSFVKNEAMESELGGGYRPRIAGYCPVGAARKWVYLSTQSLVHAYVMWRFHGSCYDQIERTKIKNDKRT